ncbi:uncharacterized protein RabX1 [Prorops nasuta]|uniref:uncharacterized protein RabX1 n=1 Tax=Prorops nasuta TaxID=863751 RepID=UPI0034CE8316
MAKNMKTKELEAKVVALGSQGVGKTMMITRYIEKTFNNIVRPTIAASYFNCRVNIGNANILLKIWDTAGQERFRAMAPMYYRNVNVGLLVFDLSDYSTFKAIKSWVSELRRNVDGPMVLAVIGNKCDLITKRQVDIEEARKYATSIGASYHEISALYCEGVDDVFFAIALGILQLYGCEDNDSLRVDDSTSSGVSSTHFVPLTPSAEDNPQSIKLSVPYAITEQPWTCC